MPVEGVDDRLTIVVEDRLTILVLAYDVAIVEEVAGTDLGAFFDSWLDDRQIPPIPAMGLEPPDLATG